MNTAQVILRTIVTTVDVILALSVIKSNESTDVKRLFTIIVLMNIAGVWT